MCRARQELSNGAFLAKFGIDTAENELPKVSMKRGVPDRSCTPHQASFSALQSILAIDAFAEA